MFEFLNTIPSPHIQLALMIEFSCPVKIFFLNQFDKIEVERSHEEDLFKCTALTNGRSNVNSSSTHNPAEQWLHS